MDNLMWSVLKVVSLPAYHEWSSGTIHIQLSVLAAARQNHVSSSSACPTLVLYSPLSWRYFHHYHFPASLNPVHKNHFFFFWNTHKNHLDLYITHNPVYLSCKSSFRERKMNASKLLFFFGSDTVIAWIINYFLFNISIQGNFHNMLYFYLLTKSVPYNISPPWHWHRQLNSINNPIILWTSVAFHNSLAYNKPK